jgi:hypothetical protein
VSRSYVSILAALAILAAPSTAFADCPSTLTLQKRIDCLNTALNAAVTSITALQTANDALETANDALEDSNAALEAQLAALDDEVANISADYLVSGDLDDYATLDYVDSLFASGTDGIPNLSDYLSVDTATDSIVFTGANVFVQSGSGATNGTVNGLGNLIVGYNEDASVFGNASSERTGSHNLVVGAGHTYSSYGAFVSGWRNAVTGRYSSVSGGALNVASGSYSSVSGGEGNEASGTEASVLGGYINFASAVSSTVCGGWGHFASGFTSSVSGGRENTASGAASSVSGGEFNVASGNYSSILGGNSVTVSTIDGTSP